VGDDDLVALAYSGQLLHRVNDVVLLNIGGRLLASLEERVSA
jgi:predicted methyltransferase